MAFVLFGLVGVFLRCGFFSVKGKATPEFKDVKSAMCR